MNWSRAKTILILAFLVTNIILGYSIYNENEKLKITENLNNQYYEEVIKTLEVKNIKLKTNLPNIREEMQNATVEYQLYQPKIVAGYFFEEPQITEIEDKVIFQKNSEKLEVINNKELVYVKQVDEKLNEEITPNQAFEIADKFLKQHNFEDLETKKVHINSQNGRHKLIYTKTINDKLVEESKMEFVVSSQGVLNFDRIWISDVVLKKEIVILEDPIESLLKLLSEDNIENTEIIDLQACYYFGPGKDKLIDYKDAKKGEGIPAWRILLSDGRKYFFE